MKLIEWRRRVNGVKSGAGGGGPKWWIPAGFSSEDAFSHGTIFRPTEANNETINHLLDECPIAEDIWEKGTEIFKKKNKHKGHPDLTIEKWLKRALKNEILNKVWELFPGFAVWEI